MTLEELAPYGFCPRCGAPGLYRERRPNGDDECTNGHKYPSLSAKPSPLKGNSMDKSQKISDLQARVDAFQAELDALKNPEPEVDWSKMAGRLVMVRDGTAYEWEGPFVYRDYHADSRHCPHRVTGPDETLYQYAKPYTGPTRPNWIEWRGGERPVECGKVVLAEKRDGSIDVCGSQFFVWDHIGHAGDIMRYTIIEP